MSTTQDFTALTDVQVRVFHNNHVREKYLNGHEHDQTVTEVFTYATPPKATAHDLTVAEEAFELFNIGHDPAFGTPEPPAVNYRNRRNRSLSVGDVLAIDDRFYSCDARGWRELTEPPTIAQRAAPGTTPLY